MFLESLVLVVLDKYLIGDRQSSVERVVGKLCFPIVGQWLAQNAKNYLYVDAAL